MSSCSCYQGSEVRGHEGRQTREESAAHPWECFHVRVVVGGMAVSVLDVPSLNTQS